MKNLITTFFLLLFVSTSCFPTTYLSRPAVVDGFFDSYKSNIHWSERRVRLDYFAIAISSEPKSIGYIGFESGKKESLKKARARLNLEVGYLIHLRHIDKNRIVVVYIGEKEEPHTILQTVMTGSKPPF